MWNFVSTIQATLDEAAGINTRGADGEETAQQPNKAAHYNYYDHDEGKRRTSRRSKSEEEGMDYAVDHGEYEEEGQGGGGVGGGEDDDSFDLYADEDDDEGGDALPHVQAASVANLRTPGIAVSENNNIGWVAESEQEEDPFDLDYGDEDTKQPVKEIEGGFRDGGHHQDGVETSTAHGINEQQQRTSPATDAGPGEGATEETLMSSPLQHEGQLDEGTPKAKREEGAVVGHQLTHFESVSVVSGEGSASSPSHLNSVSAEKGEMVSSSQAEKVSSVGEQDSIGIKTHVGADRQRHHEEDQQQQRLRQQQLEEQMMRLQTLLAEESAARASAEEKLSKAIAARQRIEERARTMREHHAAALDAARQKGAQSSSQLEAAMAALQQEGSQMSRQLGEERARTRELQSTAKALEKKLESTQQALSLNEEALSKANLSLKDLTSKSKAAASEVSAIAASATAKEEALNTLRDENEALKAVIEELQQATQREIQDFDEKERALQLTFEEERSAFSAELEGLRSQMRRQAVDHERQLVAMEREVAAASERAHTADLRAMEASRAANDAAREVGGELASLSDRATRLQDQLREKTQQITALQHQLREDREVLITSHKSEVERLHQQLASMRNGHGDAATRLRDLQEETRDEREQWRRREMSLTETIQELRAAVRTSYTPTTAAAAASMRTSVESDNIPRSPFRAVTHPIQANQQQQKGDHFLTSSGIDAQMAAGAAVADSAAIAAGSIPSLASTSPSSHAPFGYGGAGASSTNTNRYVEKELARVSTALANLTIEHRQLVDAHTALTEQHELLLEMYGEKEEETAELHERLQSFEQQQP